MSIQWDKQTYTFTDKGSLGKLAFIIGIVALIPCVIAFFVDRSQFYFSWLTAFVFWLTVAAGGLFFTMLHHLTGATWSVVLRRISEAIMTVLPYMILAAIPIFFGIHDLFHWSHAEVMAGDALLSDKAPYLNIPFFIIRTVMYFAIWTILVLILRKTSLAQDNGHTEALNKRFKKTSAPGMILFALTLTFASFDWLMSLDPHWYSTIFGVYIFSGGVVGVLCFMILVIMYLRSKNIMSDMISAEHYHDLGKLTFAFIIFWGYMAFSQYFLIWYGNIPEETTWYLHRWVGSWKAFSMIILFGHFVFPFFYLFPRAPKRKPAALVFIGIWMLVMHWVDMYWVVMPNFHHHSAHLSWIDLVTTVAIGGLFVGLFWHKFTSCPAVPKGDPRLAASIDFVNL